MFALNDVRKLYFKTLIIVSIMVAFFALPNVAFYTFFFTIGIAMVLLVPLPYLFVGLLALLPVFAFWKKKLLRLPMLIAGAVIFLSPFCIPQYLSNKGLQNDLATRTFVAAKPIKTAHPIGIEIQRPASRNPDLYVLEGKSGALFGSQPCFDLCERLLTGGEVAWVRLVLVDDAFGNRRATTSALLLPGDNTTCHELNPDLPFGAPCVLFALDHRNSADLTIKLDEGRTAWTLSPLTPYQPMGYRNATMHAGPNTNASLLFNSTQILHDRPTGAIWFRFVSFGPSKGGNGGFQFGRLRSASAPIDITGAVQQLGIALGPVRPSLPKSSGTESNPFIQSPPDAQDALYAASLITSGTSSAGSNAFSQVVQEWHDRLRWKTSLSDADRAIFCATLAGARIQKHFWADQVIKKHSVTCGSNP